jgi:hypothetical protein
MLFVAFVVLLTRSFAGGLPHQAKFTSTPGFLRKKEHPVSKWILNEMNRVDKGDRPLRQEAGGDHPVFAPVLKLHLMKGHGTEPKFMYAVLEEMKGVDADAYTRRGDPNNAEALNELSTQEKQALERAFQTTLSKWYAATVNWMDGCQARRAQGSPPAPLTKSAANKLCYLHWDGFPYAKEPRKADNGKK